jgi:hypothetical protein
MSALLCTNCRPDPDAGIGAKAPHSNPGKESVICQCDTRTCACYGYQVRVGVRKDRSDRGGDAA